MPTIQVLEKQVAELIAAGEVVERPASVAKELLENAIDAGATQITLAIEGGGIRLLEVQDNGCGVEQEDLPKAFIRHATSKIARKEDLDSIHTLGFRGEALPSIASVARVEMTSRVPDRDFAYCYRISGGQELGLEEAARPVGTTIRVEELFYNTPARMKFLKKDSSEGTFVGEVVQELALSHPEISFRFIREGKQQFVTPGDGSLLSAACAVLGREFSRDLLEVNSRFGLYQVFGLVTPPRACRGSRSAQYFYINGRYVKNRTVMAALEAAYKGTLMQGRFPGGILVLTMPPELVDVNVHPAKTEVRFAREKEVFDAVYYGVKEALAAPGSGDRRFDFSRTGAQTAQKPSPAAKPAQFTTMTAQEYRAAQGLPAVERPAVVKPAPAPAPQPQAPAHREAADLPEPTPVPVVSMAGSSALRSERQSSYALQPSTCASEQVLEILPEEDETLEIPVKEKTLSAPSVLEEAVKVPEQPPEEPDASSPEQLSLLPEEQGEEPLQYIGEVFKTYIITQRGEELCLLDKHAAHERILYERLAAGYGKVPGQTLLEPVRVNLSAQEKQAVLENLEMLEDTGLGVEDFGGGTVLVREVPADVEVSDVEDLLLEVASGLARGSKTALSEKTQWVMHSMACRAAIKAGDKTDPSALLQLAQDILSGKVPSFCPHGRPVVLRITRRELEKQFGRIV